MREVYYFGQISQHKSGTADDDAKRRILEIIRLDCWLDSATLVPGMRKPFDVLDEGLVISD
jgi:site-specific DNA recombinase